ncbi:hypothetical protein DPMN_186389 [Dreissena polymorpha]|uniref:Uncharacterized protein n=2 Tax=Dreissena polymorpha TaxID=45954 RepID=A0A9D4DNM9_DREPO|nr:hypothetical protein DPMN_186389 [Dreissena polymorpha]
MAKIDKTCTRTRYKSYQKQTEKQRKKAENRLKKKRRTKIRNAKRDQKQTYYQDRIDDDNYIPQKGSNDQDVKKHDRKMCWVCRTNDAGDILEEQVFESYEQFYQKQKYYRGEIDDDNHIFQKGSNDQDAEIHDRKMCWVCRSRDIDDMIEDQFLQSYESFLEEKYKEEFDNCFADEISGIDDEKQNQAKFQIKNIDDSSVTSEHFIVYNKRTNSGQECTYVDMRSKTISIEKCKHSVFLSPNDYLKIEELSEKLKQIDAKLAQYKSLKGIKKTKNLQNDVVKTVSSNVFDRIPIDVINKILGSGEDENMFALIERIKSSNVEEKRKYADIDISDTEISDTLNDDEKEIMNGLAVKRMRKSGETKAAKKPKKEKTILSDLELSDDDE